MKFGLLHLFENPGHKTEKAVVEENLEMVQGADEMGYDSVWLAEHHFSEYGVMPSISVMAAALAAQTKRIRIGSGVVVLPLHNPIRVAEEFAMVDLLSDGRLEFGVGRGYQPSEFAGFGVNMEDSRERFDEYLEVILKLWSGEEVTFDGKYIQLDGVRVRPKPLQDPHPPVWAAALSPGSFSLVGSKGHNLLFPPPWAPSTTAIDAYRQSLAAAGHDPESKRVAALVHLYVDDDTERAKRDFEDPLIWYYRTFSGLVARPASASAPASYEHYGSLRDLTQTVTYDQLLDLDGVVVGDPETCIRKIRHLDEIYGLSDILFWTLLGGLDHRKVMRSMELCAKHVMPRFQDGLKVG
jgi:natural product biosynthesis luciferase-like monooxygenase protein